ncbi:glycosyltransferase [Bosea sp. (in: a-proteobacteria)]|uniref:glycosyltransferase n=1 Tax=Bosea sp. (in: a-proteobacteria) TaxID=1871050 RepID=UPI0027353F4E|nr:glycosyltransferase [Bosea sp. (in: a-proteobacteria)]MDP3409160.1 glycosyltransferase [Bosea sp. (in: a-proteobacteria)]
MSKRYLILLSSAAETCGVEEFARQFARRLSVRGGTWVLGEGGARFFARLRDFDGIVLNFPIVAWKRRLVWPALIALATRLMRKEVVVVLHEWTALDWKRRVVLAPVVALATRIVFSAPEIADEFRQSRLSSVATGDRDLIPIPPNLLAPPDLQPSAVSERLIAERGRGRLILGQFGSIYPKKQSKAVLHVAERLIARGHDVFVVFIGSFIKGNDDVEQDFFRTVQAAGLTDRVLVSGYVGDERELFAMFEAVDVFCYVFPEGLTSRRGSVLAAALFGKPVVVNAPARADSLAHHALYRRLIDARALRLVPTDADDDGFADAVWAAATLAPEPVALTAEIDAVWRDVESAICR